MHVDLQDGLMMNGHHLYHSHHGHGHGHLVDESILPDENHELQCGTGNAESTEALQVRWQS
jgi:hypothetical protein